LPQTPPAATSRENYLLIWKCGCAQPHPYTHRSPERPGIRPKKFVASTANSIGRTE
jgi:hypothetical protein